MSHEHHKAQAEKKRRARVYVLTVSDTRTEADDAGGALARQLVAAAGHEVTGYAIVRDEPTLVEATLRGIAQQKGADVAVVTGGTGISRRDNTYEAVFPLLEKRIDGFGEIFRSLSYQEIGSAAMLSRAVAGLHQNLVVFAIPGSLKAVRLAMEKLIVPELSHLIFEVER